MLLKRSVGFLAANELLEILEILEILVVLTELEIFLLSLTGILIY